MVPKDCVLIEVSADGEVIVKKKNGTSVIDCCSVTSIFFLLLSGSVIANMK